MEKQFPEEPFKEVLDDMGIELTITREEFFFIVASYAEKLYEISKKEGYQYGQQIEGLFHWRVISPTKFFKVYFTYHHSEDMSFSVDGFDELTFEEYLVSLTDEEEKNSDCNCIKFVNEQSDLAKGVNKLTLN